MKAADPVSIGEVAASGGRIIDMGGAVSEDDDSEDYDGKSLVIFAVDPGITSGWSALKVPVGRLRVLGATRTLPRCRWRHGQILRSPVGTGTLSQHVSDSHHASLILSQASQVYRDFVYEREDDDPEDWEGDEFVFVLEGFSLRMMSMDTNLLAPVRILDRLLDRMYMQGSELPVFFQSSSEAMNTVTDSRLKDWGMYDSHSGVHARDADRHAILFLRKFADNRRLQARLGFN